MYTDFGSWLQGNYGFGTNRLVDMDRQRRRSIEDEWEKYYNSQTQPTAAAPSAPYTPPAEAAPAAAWTDEWGFEEAPTESVQQTVYNYPGGTQEWTQTGDAITGPQTTSPWGSPIGTQQQQSNLSPGGSVYQAGTSGSSGPTQWANQGWTEGSWGGYANSAGQVANNMFQPGTQTDTQHPFYDPNSQYYQQGTGQAPPSSLFSQKHTELQRQYSNQNPEGYWMYWLGQQGLAGMDAKSQAAQSMYRDAMAGYGAAKVNNAELDLADYLDMFNIQRLLNEMSYDQLGMTSPTDPGDRNRWGMRAT